MEERVRQNGLWARKRQIWRGEGAEERADVNGQLATQVQGNIRAWAMTGLDLWPWSSQEGCVDYLSLMLWLGVTWGHVGI